MGDHNKQETGPWEGHSLSQVLAALYFLAITSKILGLLSRVLILEQFRVLAWQQMVYLDSY